MNNETVLTCEALSKSFHDGTSVIHVLNKIDLTIQPGELVAIVGNSGSGKSTLLHLLGGLDKPTSGVVKLAGNDLAKLSERNKSQLRNRHLGFVYQFHHLLPEFTALENVCMPLLIAKIHPLDAAQRAEHLLEQVGLKNRLHHKIGALSGGERQRVAIARALVNNPLCVLADEPTGNLDHYNAERVFAVLLEMQKKYRTSVVMVTHDRNLARQASRILMLENGKLIQSHHNLR